MTWIDDQVAQWQALRDFQQSRAGAPVLPPGGVPGPRVRADSIRGPRALPSQLVTAEADAAAPAPAISPTSVVVELGSAPLVQQVSLVVASAALGWYLGDGKQGAMVGAALGAGVVGGMVSGVIPAPDSWTPPA